jgi:Tfp pilus assembly protein PilO
MILERWRQLDPQMLPDWPHSAQIVLLLAAWLCASAGASVLLWHDDFSHWQTLQQQQRLLRQRKQDLIQAQQQMTRLAPWFPRKALGCHQEEVTSIAAQLHLTAAIGPGTDDTPHGPLIEASTALLIHASYHDLQMFVSELAQAHSVWLLDPLTLKQGPEQLIELQAQIRCIHKPGAQEAP